MKMIVMVIVLIQQLLTNTDHNIIFMNRVHKNMIVMVDQITSVLVVNNTFIVHNLHNLIILNKDHHHHHLMDLVLLIVMEVKKVVVLIITSHQFIVHCHHQDQEVILKHQLNMDSDLKDHKNHTEKDLNCHHQDHYFLKLITTTDHNYHQDL